MINGLIGKIASTHPLLSLYAWRRGWVENPEGTGCIYILADPRNRRIRYVGLTTRHFASRWQEHTGDPQASIEEWVGQLSRVSLRPEMIVVCYAPRVLLPAIELALINFGYHFLGWELLNEKGLIT